MLLKKFNSIKNFLSLVYCPIKIVKIDFEFIVFNNILFFQCFLLEAGPAGTNAGGHGKGKRQR